MVWELPPSFLGIGRIPAAANRSTGLLTCGRKGSILHFHFFISKIQSGSSLCNKPGCDRKSHRSRESAVIVCYLNNYCLIELGGGLVDWFYPKVASCSMLL